MLQALGDPVSLLLLLVAFVLALVIQGLTQALIATRVGDPRPRQERRLSPDPRRHIDPFGAVGGLIAGIGWAKPYDPPDRRRRGALVAVLATGPLLLSTLGLLLLVAFRLLAGSSGGLPSRGLVTLLQFGIGGPLELRALLLIGVSWLFFGVLALVPLPPLAGGYLLFGLAPRTGTWQKAEYQLIERNIGIAVLLALLLIPLGGPRALLPSLLDTLLGPLVSLVTGGR